MKNLLSIILLSMLTLSCASQQKAILVQDTPTIDKPFPLDETTGKVKYEQTFDLNGTANQLLSLCKEYSELNRDRFILYSTSVGDKAWAYGRARFLNDHKDLRLGFASANKDGAYIKGKCAFFYRGEEWDCVGSLLIGGDVIMKFKDGKMKIEITNLKYIHGNTNAPPRRKPMKHCGEYGTMEELIKCDICEGTQKTLAPFLKNAPYRLMNRIANGMMKDSLQKIQKDENW